jgi:hypothetical protein
MKEKDKAEQFNNKVQLVNEQVEAWCKRIIDKIDQQLNENIGAYQDKTMAFSFQKITQAVCKQLEVILMDEDDKMHQHIAASDFMNEFYADEYLQKNRRIRPLSGKRLEQEEMKHASDGPSRLGEHGPEDEDAYNKGIAVELHNERKAIEGKKLKFERERREEEER